MGDPSSDPSASVIHLTVIVPPGGRLSNTEGRFLRHDEHIFRAYPVLFVDDEEMNHTVFEASYKDEFEIEIAASADEALAILRHKPIAVMIADQRMPGVTGIELCERVRVEFPDVLRILATAYSEHQVAIEAINRAGVLRYVTKPWTMEEMREVLRSAVTRAHVETMRRELRTALIERERLSGVAAARAAILHDLGNTATMVEVSCSLIERIMRGAAERDPGEVVADVRAEMANLRAATNHLTALHRDRRTLDAPRGARQAVRLLDVLDTVAHLAGAPSLTIRCDSQLTVKTDFVDLSRILLNLVLNARRALEDDGTEIGEIRLEVSAGADEVVIRVADNGPGVPSDLRDRVFDEFFTTRRATGGSGLGLAICRELAAANGATLSLEDSDLGACFALSLPTGAAVAPPSPPAR